MKAEKSENFLTWGISLLTFGVMFLIRQLNFLPYEISELIFDFKNYPLILGVIFLITHRNKNLGWVLIVVAIIFRISDIVRITRQISDFVWPVLLIVAGVILILNHQSKKRKKQ